MKHYYICELEAIRDHLLSMGFEPYNADTENYIRNRYCPNDICLYDLQNMMANKLRRDGLWY